MRSGNLVTTVELKVLKPLYYDKFMCIGAACEENCCIRPWQIVIDKKTYIKYRNSKDPEFRKKIEKCVKRMRGETASDTRYAEFVFGNGGRCPFQTQEGLCEIHRDLGPEYLCRTCLVYPRSVRTISKEKEYHEFSISMSCPQAVRVALFDTEPMEFTAEMVEYKLNDTLIQLIEWPFEGEVKTQYLKHGWAMREAAITIMQNRSCPLPHRMIIIAMMLNDAVKLHDEGNPDGIPATLGRYSQAVYGNEFTQGLEDIGANEKIRRKMHALMYYTISSKASISPDTVYGELTRLFRGNAGLPDPKSPDADQTKDMQEFFAHTVHTMELNWGDFMENWGHVLENYLVNFMFSELFPLRYHDKGLDPYHHTFVLAEQYALLKMLLCGNLPAGERFSKQYITRIMSHVAEVNQHSMAPLRIVENFKAAGITSPLHLYNLLF